MAHRPIHSVTRDELADRFREWQQPAWRVDQLLDWLHAKRVGGWDAMTNLPKALRDRLAAEYRFVLPELVQCQGSADATRKFLWRLHDGALVETVLIPANPALYGDRADRHTLCVSTQVGCAYGCRFCASGLDGFRRNLGPEEIVGQVLAVERWHAQNAAREASPVGSDSGLPDAADTTTTATTAVPAPPTSARPASPARRLVDNLVVMGMGEPLANYANLLAALRLLNAPWGGGIGARKITVSTSGLAPQIRQLAGEPEQFRLAISLHGATDAVRDRIMPVNRKYPLAELTAACAEYLERKGKMITFEYILLAGVNDAREHAPSLAALARRLHAKVNLIPYNAVEGLEWTRPADEACERFAARLRDAGVAVTLRLEKGHDIEAACGQLRLRVERASAAPLPPGPPPATLAP